MYFPFPLQVDSSWTAQRPVEARSNANTAKVLNIVGFTIGIIAYAITAVIVIIYLIVIFAAVGSASSYNPNNYDTYSYN